MTRIAFGVPLTRSLIALAMLNLRGHNPPSAAGHDPRKSQKSHFSGHATTAATPPDEISR